MAKAGLFAIVAIVIALFIYIDVNAVKLGFDAPNKRIRQNTTDVPSHKPGLIAGVETQYGYAAPTHSVMVNGMHSSYNQPVHSSYSSQLHGSYNTPVHSSYSHNSYQHGVPASYQQGNHVPAVIHPSSMPNYCPPQHFQYPMHAVPAQPSFRPEFGQPNNTQNQGFY